MDTAKSNSISINMNIDKSIQFKAIKFNCLYTYHIPDHKSIEDVLSLFTSNLKHSNFYCFNIDTVTKRSDKYTKR